MESFSGFHVSCYIQGVHLGCDMYLQIRSQHPDYYVKIPTKIETD